MIKMLKNILYKLTPKLSIAGSSNSRKIINGSFQANNQVISEELQINGAATFEQNTIVKNAMTINGQLKASETTFEANLFAHGASHLINSSLKSNAYFSGNLTASDCTILHNITLLTHESTFINCQINHITIQQIPYLKTGEIVFLRNGCVVNGDISFDSNNGQVHLESSSRINGKVHGGKVIYI